MNETILNIINLNSLIQYWRAKKDAADNPHDRLIASCYVDAYQTVRVNHNLPLLSKDDTET